MGLSTFTSIFNGTDTLAILIAGFVFGVVYFKYGREIKETFLPLIICIVCLIISFIMKDEFYVMAALLISTLSLGYALGMITRGTIRLLIMRVKGKKKKN